MTEVLRRNPITQMNFVDQGNRLEAVMVVEGEGKPTNLVYLVEKMCKTHLKEKKIVFPTVTSVVVDAMTMV